MKILVVEDERRIAQSLKKGLEQENYAVDLAYDGQSGYDLAVSDEYILIILDLMLPKMDGLTICKKIRESEINVPILILTAKGQVPDKVSGLDSGADDYMVKPFAFNELIARVKALTRRPTNFKNDTINIGDIELDISNFTLKKNGSLIKLTKKEFVLLEYLMHNKGRVLSKNNIISRVWDYDANILENTVEVYIRALRLKLKDSSLISTVRGFGYKFL